MREGHAVLAKARAMTADAFTPTEQSRYARHFSLAQVGQEGQRRLKRASVLCVGAGGLGSPVTMHLAAAGVGRLGLVDADRVELSNLHRQLLHGASDVGRKKVESAVDRLREINPHTEVVAYDERFTAANARQLLADYDILVDGTDNFPTRYLSNDISYFLGKPNVHGSIYQFEGQVSVFAPSLGGPCYRCLFPKPPKPGLVPSCAEGGVLGVLPGIIGAMQANEAIKLILGIGEPLVGRLLHFDALTMKTRMIQLRRDEQCPLCGPAAQITELMDYEDFCGLRKTPARVEEVTPKELADVMASAKPPLLLDVREDYERAMASITPSLHIPLGQLAHRLDELPRDQALLVYCHAGVRSEQAGRLLLEAGFTQVRHLRGGIAAWMEES